MPKFYLKTWMMLVLAMCLTLCFHVASAQCSFTNLLPAYCTDDASFILTGGTNYYGPGITGATFSPATAGVGTHTLYTTNGSAVSYNTSVTGTFNPDGSAATPVNFSGLPADENSDPVAIGFTFNFFGTDYSSLIVNGNGYVGFGPTTSSNTAQLLPDPTAPNNFIAGAWDDLDVTGGTISTAISGTAPFRTFIVNFNLVPYTTGPGTVSFQIQLHETTNIIEIHSIDIQDNGGLGATQGIEDATGSTANFVAGRNDAAWTVTGDYVAFVPTCLEIKTVTITAPPTASLGVTAPPNICAGSGATVTIASSQLGVDYELRRVSDNSSLSAIVGGNGSNLPIISNSLAVATNIKVYARNTTTGCDTDLSATVIVDPDLIAPSIGTQPVTAIVCEDGTVQFTVGASGTSLTYQWREEGNPLANNAIYSGTTSSVLTITNVASAFNGRHYDVIVSGTCTPPVTSAQALLNVNEKPEITLQPVSSIICAPANTSFTVNAGVTTTPTYQWQVSTNSGLSYTNLTDDALYSGTATATLALTAATVSNNGYLYRIIIGGACGPSVTSNSASLTVNQSAAITTPPANFIVCEDGTAQFTVTATGTGLTYQWREEGTPLSNNATYSGVGTSTLTIINVPSALNGLHYDVVVGGTCAAPAPSAQATLTVNEKPEITTQPASSIICQGANTTFTVNAGVTTAPTYQWQVSTNSGVSYTNLTNAGIYSGVNTATLTLTAPPLANNGYLYRVFVGGTCAPGLNSNGAVLTVNQPTSITSQPGTTAAICESGTIQFSVVASGTGLTYIWKEDGVTITNGGVYSGANTNTLTLTNVPIGFNGKQYNVDIAGTCVASTLSTPTILTVNKEPEITGQPASSIICQGAATSFTVNAGATSTPTYQWQVSTNAGVSYSNLANAGIYSGVTTATLNLTATPAINNGYLYRVNVGGACTPGVTSNSVLLTVNQTPVINTQPVTKTICEDGTVQFSVVASGTTITYQWREQGNPLSDNATYSGTGTSMLTISNVPSSLNGFKYDVIVSGTCTTPVASAQATLNVNEQPEITSQPVSSIICQGNNTSFAVNAGVTTGVVYQWQVSTNGGVSFTNLTNAGIYSGVATATLNLTTTPAVNNGYVYRVTISGACTPAVISNGALLTVNQSTSITSQPGATASVCEDGTIQFTVVATGTGLTYTWKEDGTTITNGGVYSGATTNTLTLTTVPIGFNGKQYNVDIAGTCTPSTLSTLTTLTVNKKAEITGQPVNSIICQGSNTSFTVNPGATSSPTYQWQVSTDSGVTYGNLTNTGIYSGVTTATLNLTTTPAGNNGYLYRVIVGGSCAPGVNSNGALLTVNQLPVINTQPVTATICEDGTVQFTVAATGTSLTYQWREQGNPLSNNATYSGTGTATLTITNVPSALNGLHYDVLVGGTCTPGVTSAQATLNVNEKPEITAQPLNSIICQGNNTLFTVNAGVTTAVTYQWQVSTNSGVTYTNLANGGVYSGVLTATLNLTLPTVTNNGYLYRVVVGGTCAPSVISNGALLTVNQTPAITTQPVTATICEDGTAQFTVATTGTALTYQWREEGVPLSNNATYSGTGTTTLTIVNVVSAFNGRHYDVVVSGTCNPPATSTLVTLNVNEKPEITAQPVSSTICETSNTSFTVNAGVTTAATYQWQVSTNSGVTYTNLANAGIYSGVATATLNLTATPAANNAFLYRVLVGGTCAPGITSNGALLTVNQIPVINTQPVTATICEDGTVQFNVVTTGTAITYQWRQQGINLSNNATFSGVGTATLTITNVASSLNGLHYDVVVGGTCTPPVTSAQATLNVNEKPEITSQPVNSTICQGNNTSFTVNAGVTTAPTYQWQVSTDGGATFTNLANAGIYSGVATATLALTAAPPANNGYVYRVSIGGTCSPGVVSNGAVLTVNRNAAVTTQPVSAIICEDGTVQFSVVATGTGITYQWRENSVPISNGPVFSGVSTAVLTLTNVPSSFNGKQYDVILLGACAPAASSIATLTVNEKPEITAQPVNSTICQGANTSFTVNAGVTTAPTYQWQVSTNGGVTFTNLTNTAVYAGVATATLSLANPSLAFDGLLYRVIIGGTCAPTAISNGAVLKVNDNPVIGTQPTPKTICENSSTTFSVAVTGTGLTYQWQENGTNLSNNAIYNGVTTPTLTISNATIGFNGRNYSVVVTATCGTITSSNALLTINRIPNAFAADAAICSGQTTNVAITNPNGVPSTTFTWTVQSNTNVSGAAGGAGALIAQALTSTDGVNPGTITYLILPSAAGCNGTPYAVNITVKPIPNAAASPQTICSGGNTSVAITNPNGVAGTSFIWTVFSSANVTGASAGSGGTISQVLSSTDGTNTGTVTYRITPSAGSCPGATVDVTVTVSPSPKITSPSTALIQEICSATPLNFLPTASITGTVFNWTSSVIGTLSGVSATGSGAITDTPINATSSNAVIIYTITPSISGCNGAPVNYVVTVRPVTTASASPQIICSGTSTNVVITNPNGVSGTTYTWTTSATNASGASAGSGNVISQVLNSADGLNNGSVTYTITPSANGCPGPTFPVTVTVKPVPVMTNIPTSRSQQICSTEVLSFIPTASIGGTTFAWTTTIVGPINAATVTASGSGNITDAPQNTGNVNGTVTYHIIPSINGCDGSSIDFVVTVKPLPSASAAPLIICSGQTAVVNLSAAPRNVPGTTFVWTATSSANVTGSANGNGSTISQTLSTTNAAIGTVMYTITPTANGCAGPTSNVTVTINPIATVNAGVDYSVCEPVTIPISGTIGGSATSGNWTLVTGTGTLSASSVSGTTVTANYTVNASDIGNPVTFLLSTNDPDAGGPCSILTDQLVVNVNRQARVTLPADYVVCEPGIINLSGILSGSATTGLWSVDTGNGVLSASSVTGSNVTASYTVPASDVNTSLRFRLTTNDPDASGPCVAESAVINIFVNMSAKVNAGSDFQVCENQPINLTATSGGSTSTVLWSGGSGAAQFAPVNNINSTYTITPGDITAGGVTLTITTNDPDAAGPCTSTSDPIFVKINKLPAVYLVGLDPVYAENGGIDNLDGFPVGGVFTGPGIVAGTSSFNPANAGFGTVVIRYTYIDPTTGCSNFVEKTTIVNPVTDVDFYIKEDPRVNGTGIPTICANQGFLTLKGLPDVSEGFDPTSFRGISPELVGRVSFDGTDWKLLTDGLNAGSYLLQYIFTNEFAATDTLTKDLIVYSAPKAVIDLGNSCIDDVVTFLESSNIPNNLSGGSIVTWTWFYGEGSNGSSGSVMEPQYQYADAGPKNISLEVVTDQGCKNKAAKSIVIGAPPKPDFSWTSYCKGDATKFKDGSLSTYGNINSYSWDFSDGGTSAMKNPSHAFANFASYPVKLSIGTDAGCFADVTKQVYIQDLQVPIAGDPYSINFESGPGTWVPITAEGDPNDSWIFGLPNGVTINTAHSGMNAWYTGGNSGSYFDNEKSYVIGPCLDLSNLKRPMISLNYAVNTQAGFDGAVVQYSVNGGGTWQTIGDAEGGGNSWYNSRNLSGQPGGQSNFAWSNDSSGRWIKASYNLDQIPAAVRDTVIFRMAFGANGDTRKDGFAFDDFFVGEKTRNVLVETFANINVNNSNQASADLKDRYAKQFAKKDSSDFFFVEYHVPNGGPDPINAANPQDPIARALLYNVAQPPSSIMDGKQDNNLFNGYTGNITAIELDRRALQDPTFKIDIDTINSATSNTKVRLALTYTYIDSTATLASRVTMQAAIVEKGVDQYGPVVRKLLLGSEGKTLDRSWTKGDKEIANVEYDIEVPILNPDSVFIMAFIQDNVPGAGQSKQMLQARIVKSHRKKSLNVTSIEDNPITGELKELSIYPNPASNQVNVSVPIILMRKYQWKLIDQRGVSVLDGDLAQDFTHGPQEIDISRLANGIYFMSIQTGEKSIIYRKIAVMNKN